MHTYDFLTATFIAIIAAACLYFKMYFLSLFVVLFFVLFIVNVFTFYITQPLPRTVIGMGLTKEVLADILMKAEEETEEKPNE